MSEENKNFPIFNFGDNVENITKTGNELNRGANPERRCDKKMD